VESSLYIFGSVCTCVPAQRKSASFFINSVEDLAFSVVIKITKDDFEAAVISAIKRSFQIPFLLAVIFILLSVCVETNTKYCS
jgi:hypothetical protein